MTEDTQRRNPVGEKNETEEPLLQFRCSKCGLNEHVHYFGTTPKFVKKQLRFKEPSFVMKDPFTPRVAGRGHLLLIGGVCAGCNPDWKTSYHQDQVDPESLTHVCVDCSVFYKKRYCVDCAAKEMRKFPEEVQVKLQKKLQSQK